MSNEKQELIERFIRMYKNLDLIEVSLSGEGHFLKYLDKTGTIRIDYFNPAEQQMLYERVKTFGAYDYEIQTAIKSVNRNNTRVFFLGFPVQAYLNRDRFYTYDDWDRSWAHEVFNKINDANNNVFAR